MSHTLSPYLALSKYEELIYYNRYIYAFMLAYYFHLHALGLSLQVSHFGLHYLPQHTYSLCVLVGLIIVSDICIVTYAC